VSASKFTLHSTNLPKPQYPVPISLTTRYVVDTKGAKHAVNISRKGLSSRYILKIKQSFQPFGLIGFSHFREESLDSGISSYDSSGPSNTMNMEDRYPSRNRNRNLEIVPSGRHKFEVRDLDTFMDESVIPLSLPKLPSVFSSLNQTIPMGGLVRSNVSQSSENDSEYGLNDNRNFERKSSIISSDAESFEEEKLMKDNNSSEKSMKVSSLEFKFYFNRKFQTKKPLNYER
jgi:hypothetical protein